MTQAILLGDVAEKIAMGPFGSNIKVSTFVESGIPIISGQHLKGITVDDGEGYNFISTEHADKLRNSNTFRGDVVFTHAGNIGQVAYIPQNSKYDRYVLSQRQFYLRPSKELSAEYLTYYFKSPKGQSQLLEFANQTGVPSLSQPATNLKKIKIELPDLATQKKIADILGTIDEKIELNRRMNDSMEQVGQALFRHYFVDNPEAEEWENGTVADLVTIYSGHAFKRTDFNPDGRYGLVTIKNVQDGNFLAECSDHLAAIPVKTPDYAHLKTGDVLLSLTGNVGRVCIVYGDDLLLNQRVAKLEGTGDRYSFAYFMFRQDEFKEKLISMSRGTAQLNLSPVETKKIKIKLPPADTLEKFYSEAELLFEAITDNYKQTQTLTTLRDTLLPRLIRGKVKV